MIAPSFDLTIPDDWSALPPTPGCVALVAEPETDADTFRCSVSVVFEDLDDTPQLGLEEFTRLRIAALSDLLTDALVVDAQPATLAGADAIVATIAYRQGNDARTLRQWAAVVDGMGMLVGAVCSNDRFAGLQATLDEIVSSLVLEDGG